MASFNDFSQYMSQQADLATDPVYSEEGISRPMDTVDKHYKQNERKPKKGRRTNFATEISKKGPLEETLFPSAVTCAKRHTTWINVLSFLKNPWERDETSSRRRAYASVATVLNILACFAEVEDPARPVIRNTQRRFTFTTGSQKEPST